MKWIITGEQAMGEVGWQKKCTVDGGKWKGLTRDGRSVLLGKWLTKSMHGGKNILDKYYILSCLSIAC